MRFVLFPGFGIFPAEEDSGCSKGQILYGADFSALSHLYGSVLSADRLLL